LAVATGQLDGRTIIVSGSDDKTVRVWDAAAGTPLAGPFTGHTDWVRTVAVGDLDGRTIVVSGGDDQAIRMWDLATWDLATGMSTEDLPRSCGKAESLPSKIDLAAAVWGVAYAAPTRLVVATELGVIDLRLPIPRSGP
jgi:WD40 repeat protein